MHTIPVQGGVPLACPRDGAPLRPFTVADVTVDSCHDCTGTWFDRTELARVTHDEELARLAAEIRDGARSSGFLCLRCRSECFVVAIVDVEVDACGTCGGLWMDGGELASARRAVATRRWAETRLAGVVAAVRDAHAVPPQTG